MKDRFRFRAWYPATDRQNSEMVYNKLEAGEIWIPESDGAPLVIMMCTGLKDKNEKLIYEGDIIQTEPNSKHDGCIGRVKYGGLAFHVTGIMKNPKWFGSTGEYFDTITNPSMTHYDEAEVIGNIYENPELLKECSKLKQ